MWFRYIPTSVALALAMTLPSVTVASPSEIEHLKQENAQMKEMLMQMQEQLQEVIMKTKAMEQAAKEGKDKKGVVKSQKENITISTTGGGIQVKSNTGSQFKIGARLMFDHYSYDEFWNSTADDEAEENEIRRARFTLSGNTGKHWSYKFTTDINHEGGRASVDTGFVQYASKPMYVRFGKFKRPAMVEERTSSKWLSTMERSIVSELSGTFTGKPSFGGVGVGFATKGDMPMSGALGIFDDEVDEDDGADIYGLGARFSISPKFDDHSFMHAGLSYYNVDYKGKDFRMRSRLGVRSDGKVHPFETDQMKTDDIDQIGVELAYVRGPFSLQGEFMNVESDGTNDEGCGAVTHNGRSGDNLLFTREGENTCDIEMDGLYAQAAYTLTGETRGYSASSGAFKSIKPKDEMGAWEVVLRYEDAEVDIPGRNISADLERLVVGLNWYVNKNVKFMLNYVDSEIDDCSSSGVTATDSNGENPISYTGWSHKKCGNNNEDSGNALTLRGQYVF